MLSLILSLAASLFNIGLFFVLLHFIFKNRLSFRIKILIALLISIISFHLFGEPLIDNITRHTIATLIFYLLLKSGLLRLEKSNNSANKEKDIKNKAGRSGE